MLIPILERGGQVKIIQRLFFLLFIVACGQQAVTPTMDILVVGSAFESTSDLVLAEQQVYAYSLCSALRSKRNMMVMNLLQQEFSFELEEVDCHQINYSTSIKTELNKVGNEQMIFVADYKKNYQSLIDTDRNGVFANFCQKTLNGNDFSDVLTQNRRIKFEYSKEDSILSVDVIQLSASDVVEGINSYKIISDPDSTYYGFTTSYIEKKSCLDPQKTYSFSQTALSLN